MTKSDTKNRKHSLPATGFGAALATLAMATNVEATVVSLDITPTTNPYGTRPDGNTYVDLENLGAGIDLYFYQFNDSVGKELVDRDGGIFGFKQTTFSNILTEADTAAFTRFLTIRDYASGTAYYAFLTEANQLGWISMNLGGRGGDIEYFAAALNTEAGGPIGIGKVTSVSVPTPSTVGLLSLGMLALGAAGVHVHRRRLKEATATATS